MTSKRPAIEAQKWHRCATAVVGFFLIWAPPASAAKKKLDLSDLTVEPSIAGRPVSGVTWLADGRSFSYVLHKGVGHQETSELWLEDAASGKKRLVVSGSTLVLPREGKTMSLAPGVVKQPAESKPISLEGYVWAPDGQTVLLDAENDLWLYRLASGRLERLTSGDEPAQLPTFSPDGRQIAFVRNNDLWIIDVDSRRERRLTTDGSNLVWNGKLDWVYEEELAHRSSRAYEWSRDGRQIAFLRLDDGPIDPYPIADFLTIPPKITWQRYPEAGAKNPVVSLHVVGIDGQARATVELDSEGYIAPSFSWTADSTAVCYRVINRSQTRRTIYLWTPGTTPRTLLTEEDPTWINDDGVEPPHFLAGGRFLWRSEKTGFAHLYVGRVSGGDLTPITEGDWMVDRLAGVDETRGLVYFTATEENARRRPIYRVGLDGKGLVKLTGTRGTHEPELSPDGKYLLDTFSTLSAPPVLSLLDSSGRTIRVIDRPQTRLADYDLATTAEIEISADDGIRLMARLTKPSDFDPGKKYPVIVFVYGGPHAQVVRDAWGATSLLDHFLASRGYLVWSLDNRGSWGRGHAWESVIWKETGRRELADQLTGVRYLTSLAYVDPTRLGIWGWSYGGYMTLYALTHAPDVWKCGIAGAPVTDWKFYDTIYTERYMRTPQENPKGYEASAPLTKAMDLKARLLIIHGTQDDNVHLQNTVAFADALVKAQRQYELKLGPGQKHGFKGKAALDFKNAAIVEFFRENL